MLTPLDVPVITRKFYAPTPEGGHAEVAHPSLYSYIFRGRRPHLQDHFVNSLPPWRWPRWGRSYIPEGGRAEAAIRF